MQFKDTLNGIAFRRYIIDGNDFSRLFTTNDGGMTWDSSNQFSPISSIGYAKDKVGGKSFYIAGGRYGSMISLDSGKTWKTLDGEMHSMISFYDSETGISTYPISSGGKGAMIFTGLPTLGINEFSNNEAFSLYPNPVKDVLSISTNIKQFDIEIYDISGRLTQKKECNQESSINISDINPGFFFVRVITSGSSYNYKMVKQ